MPPLDRKIEVELDSDLLRKPLVSVIVTNYNYEGYVVDCLRSILSQTYKHFECIVVDDCSTDGSVEQIKAFLRESNGTESFSLVQCSTNGGQMSGFLEGFRESKGSFIVFVDSDDILFPDFLDTHLQAHLNDKYTAGLTCSDEVLIDGDSQLVAGATEYSAVDINSKIRVSHTAGISGFQVEDWHGRWQFEEPITHLRSSKPLLYLPFNADKSKRWLWTTTSAMMFRRSVVEMTLKESARDIRINADFYLVNFCHYISGTLYIQTACGAYRRHGKNQFASHQIVGRGVRPGVSAGHLSNSQIFDRIPMDVTSRYAEFRDLMGDQRTLKLFVSICTPRSMAGIVSVIFQNSPQMAFTFIVAFIASKMKLLLTRFIRILRAL